MTDDINYAVRTLSTSCFSSSLLLSTNNYVFQLLCHMYTTNDPTITQASLFPWHYTASLTQHKENSHTRIAAKLDPRHQIAGFLRSDFQYSKPNKATFQLSKDLSKSPERFQHGTVFPSWLLLYHLWTLHSRLSVQFSSVQFKMVSWLQKAHMCSIPSLRSFPNDVFDTFPMFISLMMPLSCPFKETCLMLPLSTPLLQTVIPLQTILKQFFLPLFSTYTPQPPPPPPCPQPSKWQHRKPAATLRKKTQSKTFHL